MAGTSTPPWEKDFRRAWCRRVLARAQVSDIVAHFCEYRVTVSLVRRPSIHCNYFLPERTRENLRGMLEPSLTFLPPKSFYTPLWRSLPSNIRAVIAPEKFPPLQLTSRPVDFGMLPSDRIGLSWYRTIFASIGDVLSPETLPPLELESRPVDVGELVSDITARPWWASLLRNLADVVSPERQPSLNLTSDPDPNVLGTHTLLLANWSTVLKGPKVFLPDAPKPQISTSSIRLSSQLPRLDPVEVEFVNVLERDVRRDLRRSRIRQRIWIAVAAAQIVFLIAAEFWPR